MPTRRFDFRFILLLALLVVALGAAAAVKLRAGTVYAAPMSAKYYSCTPDIIVSANVRVVAHCVTGYNNTDAGNTINWFAYPTTDSAGASRMLSLLETARATSSAVTFYFDSLDTSGTAMGCAANDCRAIWAITAP
jgi:hypothetical protein